MSNNASLVTNSTTTPSPVLSIIETTKFYTSTNIIISTNINVSNIKNVTNVPQINNNYIEIHQYEYEKVLSILIFILILSLIIICIYWLIKFKLYDPPLEPHRPLFIIISYILILPWLFFDSISALHLYTHQQDRSSIDGRAKWTFTNGTLPIIFSINGDYALHFLFWLAYWCFIQLKLFKIWILRYKLEYKKHMENFSWKDKFGLKDVQKISFFVQHRSLWHNEKIILLLQFIFSIILMCFQIAIRLSSQNNPTSPINEQIFIWIITAIHFTIIIYISYYITGVFDEIYFHLQSKQIFVLCSFAVIIWLIGIIISGAAGTNIDYFLYKYSSLLFWCIWLTALCYFETKYILNQINTESSIKNTNLALSDILRNKEGFETIMRFLMNDNECGNLLCYVELSQFITRWTPQEMQTYANPNTNGIHSTPIGPHVYKYSNYDPLSNVNDMQDVIDIFPYFENKELWSETSHYQYLMNKYVSENATIPIDISDEVRQSTGQQSLCDDPEFLLLRIYQLRAEIWSLLKFAFKNKFIKTKDYIKLTDIISPKTKYTKRKNMKKKHDRVNTETIEIQSSIQSHLQMKIGYTETWEDEEKMVELPLKFNDDEILEDEGADELRYTEMTAMDLQQKYDEVVSLNNMEEFDDMNGMNMKQNDDEKDGMEYKTGWNENNEESDGMIERNDTSVEDVGMVVVTKGQYSKVDVVERNESVEYVDLNEETPYI